MEPNELEELAKYIMEVCPHEIIEGGACKTALNIIKRYRKALGEIAQMLDEPNRPEYVNLTDTPALMNRAVEMAQEALYTKPEELSFNEAMEYSLEHYAEAWRKLAEL